jgi:hypothetical protein
MPTKEGKQIRLYAIIDWCNERAGTLRDYEEKLSHPMLEPRNDKYIDPRPVGRPIVFRSETDATAYIDSLPYGIAKSLKVLPLDEVFSSTSPQ